MTTAPTVSDLIHFTFKPIDALVDTLFDNIYFSMPHTGYRSDTVCRGIGRAHAKIKRIFDHN